ncbi:ABC transporter periplasmic binding protein, thiB subfamily [Gulbenkiania indica]|uniref:ABC transporter periplasmic binding protein, thiB subfamily n=2 Tax=Gulbenkiania TaxID=397456 RepID=A0A0K6GRK2_9NEIS|nr:MULTISPECIES: thiamine ABC transporter substrate-binding protein [Gulbenkiania]TCW32119.1 thiamine transport system substrate-binding protein [Gulbenkiania mobilis]CUA81389.1 ABC transporter periplasmic binding protein, thiB subfamily [Gulbenkiania indica]
MKLSCRTFLALALAGLSLNALSAELRVITHSSFAVSKSLIADFERQNGVKVSFIKAGDAGEMLNKLILTRAQPVADVAFGLDNALVARAVEAGVVEPYTPSIDRDIRQQLPGGVVSVDYGYVTLNYDKAWFESRKLPLPRTLTDLTRPAYKDLLVVENPATSSPGLAFLAATVKALGEEGAWKFWSALRANGVKVAKGWSEAYYTDFSKNGGARPLVVSYATSPAAEVFYDKKKPAESPTGNLFLPGGVFRQVEGVALVKGGAEREAARKFVDFLRSEAVQKDLPTQMWMYPVRESVTPDPVFRHAEKPGFDNTPDERTLAAKSRAWVARWTRVVLK